MEIKIKIETIRITIRKTKKGKKQKKRKIRRSKKIKKHSQRL